MKLVLTVFISVFLFGCGGGAGAPAPLNPTSTPPAPVLTKISISPATASIHVGEEQTYIAQAIDQYDRPMTGITFTWTSSDDAANDHTIAIFHGGVAMGVSAGVMHATASASGVTSTPATLTVTAQTYRRNAQGSER